MIDIASYTEQEFILWVKSQLEKREFMCGYRLDKQQRKEALAELLFLEHKLTVKEIEKYFIPFQQAGYLSPRNKFEIMLFVLEKEYGKSFMFLEGREEYCTVTEEDVEDMYRKWFLEGGLYLSEEEKKEYFVQYLSECLGLGILEVLERISPDGILLGELCPPRYEFERAEKRIAVCFNGLVIQLPFLEVESEDELIRIIRSAVAKANKRDLTMMEPILDFTCEDGTCVTAIRPPAGREWGLRILYGASRKEAAGWEM